METEKTLQLVACFMAVIIIGVPFYVSDVYAASTLNIRRISGLDGVDNFADQTDTIIIEVDAALDGNDLVTSENLRIYIDGSEGYSYFQNCTQSGSVYKCIFTQFFPFLIRPYSFQIDLHSGATIYDDFGTPLVSKTEWISPDIVGAKVISISATPERSSQESTTINFTVEDYGITEDDTSYCSGIDRVEFYRGGYAGDILTVIRPGVNDSCTFSGSFNFQAEAGVYQSTICASAFDKFNNSLITTSCTDFFVDSIPPQPDLGSMLIVKDGTDGETIDYIGQNTVIMDISINIRAVDLNVSSVHADFTNFAGVAFSHKFPSSHTDINGTHSFVWENVPVTSPPSCVFTVTAADYLGNMESTDVPCLIKIDNDGPEVQGITTPNVLDGVYYLGKKGTLTAHVVEGGIGLNENQIFMDLSNIIAVSRLQADECVTSDNANWECYWYDIPPNVADGEYFVTIYKESKDDLDNIMTSKYEQKIGVDKESPSINQEVEMHVIPGASAMPYENLTAAGDTLEFVIEVSDAYAASANFSHIGLGDKVPPSACWKENKTTFCIWEVPIVSSGPYNADIAFTFEDFAGNMNQISRSVFVAGIINDTNPNFWDHTATCSPELVDRDTASLISQKMFCHIELTQRNKDAELITFSMEQYPSKCSASTFVDNTTVSITDFVNNIMIINDHQGSTEPFMDITFNVAEFLLDDLTFSCEFEIFSKLNEEYTLHPEKENVTVVVEFYALPAGTVDQAYTDDVEDALDLVDSIADWLGDLQELFDWLKRMCDLYGMLNNILAALTMLGVFLNIGSQIDPYGKSLEAAWISTCKADGEAKDSVLGLEEFFDPLCAFINCKWSKELLEEVGEGLLSGASGGIAQSTYGLPSSFDVKQSIVWSLLTICVPGILYNVMKWKNIQCRYATCLISQVPSGIPQSVCENSYAFEMCKFVWSQIFNLFPFIQVFSNYAGIVQNTMSDPLAAIGWIVDLVLGCSRNSCNAGSKAENIVCAVFGLLSMIGQAIKDIEMVQEDDYFDSVGDASCDDLEDARDEAGF